MHMSKYFLPYEYRNLIVHSVFIELTRDLWAEQLENLTTL